MSDLMPAQTPPITAATVPDRKTNRAAAREAIAQRRRARRQYAGAQIVQARLEAEITQGELARTLGISREQLREYEHGVHYPEAYLPQIADLTGKPEAFFAIEAGL